MIEKHQSFNYEKLLIPAREMRKKQTEAEERIWSVLRKRQINNLKFLRQKILGDFIVDFYCHEIKLIIEIDGKIHDDLKERDQMREEYLKIKFNANILRYNNEFILNNTFDIIKDKLEKDLTNLEFNKF